MRYDAGTPLCVRCWSRVVKGDPGVAYQRKGMCRSRCVQSKDRVGRRFSRIES